MQLEVTRSPGTIDRTYEFTVKFSKFCFQSFHLDTDRRVVFKFREIWQTGKSVKSPCVAYLTKNFAWFSSCCYCANRAKNPPEQIFGWSLASSRITNWCIDWTITVALSFDGLFWWIRLMTAPVFRPLQDYTSIAAWDCFRFDMFEMRIVLFPSVLLALPRPSVSLPQTLENNVYVIEPWKDPNAGIIDFSSLNRFKSSLRKIDFFCLPEVLLWLQILFVA